MNLSYYGESNIIELFLDSINIDLLINNIKMYNYHPYEYRLLLWQLTHSSETRKKEFALSLYNYTKEIIKISATESKSILSAFYSIDENLCKKICTEMNFPSPETLDVKEKLLDFDSSLFDELIQYEVMYEEKNIDYNVSELIYKYFK